MIVITNIALLTTVAYDKNIACYSVTMPGPFYIHNCFILYINNLFKYIKILQHWLVEFSLQHHV